MANPDPRYPCSSIEDDFNYGSCVASASVHIRMGTSFHPSRPFPFPSPQPGPCGRLRAEPAALSASRGGFRLPPAAPPGAGLAGGARLPWDSEESLACGSPPRPPDSAEERPPPGVGRKRSRGERGPGEAPWSGSCALPSGTRAEAHPALILPSSPYKRT